MMGTSSSWHVEKFLQQFGYGEKPIAVHTYAVVFFCSIMSKGNFWITVSSRREPATDGFDCQAHNLPATMQ